MEDSEWEVVTKSKRYRNLEKKDERLVTLNPKLGESVLPQPNRKIASIENATMQRKNNSPTKSAKTTNSEKSKSPNKNIKKDVNNAKTQKQVKPEKPKKIETVLRSITVEEFRNQITILKAAYPSSELLWLRGIGLYFNACLPFDCDAVFAGKPLHYPSFLLSKELKKEIVDFLEAMGQANLMYFYHTLLISMCVDLAKNSYTVGYKLLLQIIGRNWPEVCSNEMAKTALLRNSYQNRSNICLSIFWAIGQGGYEKLLVGVKVWQNLMLSNLEMRSYTKFVVEYFERILVTAIDQNLNMEQTCFFDILSILRANYTNIPKDCQESLKRSADLFLQKYISSSTKHANIFRQMLVDIKSSENSIELEGCTSCLIKSDDCFKTWKMNLKKQIVPSTILLNEIVKNLSNGSALEKSNSFRNFLEEASILTSEMEASKKHYPNLHGLKYILKSAQQSTQNKKRQSNKNEKKCGCCKWVLGSIFLIALIGGALTYDTNVNGRGVFAASATGKALKNAGLLPHVEKAWYKSMSTAARGYQWAEIHVPPYAKPVGKLACDLYKVSRNSAVNAYEIASKYASEKLPLLAEFVEKYIPGLPKIIQSAYVTTKSSICTGCTALKEIISGFTRKGPLSYENMQLVLNKTKNAVLDYYHVFHKKVDVYAKLK